MPRAKKAPPNRSDGRYEIKATISHTFKGQPIRKSFYSDISREDARAKADAWIAERNAAVIAGVGFASKEITFAIWARRWLELYKKGKVKDNTYAGTYEEPVRIHLIPFFGEGKLDDIRPADIQTFFDNKRNEGCALESMKKMRGCLYGIFETAVENDLCRKNPVTRNIKLISNAKSEAKRAYTQEECDSVIEFAKYHKDGLPIILMLQLGISRSELLGLKHDCVDLEKKTIHIKHGVTDIKDTKTNKWTVVLGSLKNDFRERTLPISDLAAELLEKQMKNCHILTGGSRRKGIEPKLITTDLVFPNSCGGLFSPKNWSQRVYKRFMEDMHKANPHIEILNPHELRHTFATLANKKGVDLFILAKLMGHSDLRMLYKRYAHTDVEDLKKGLGL